MTEYIEREATLKLLRSLGSRDYRREKGTICDAIKMITHSAYTPTADVVEVRHGEWVLDTSSCVASLKCGECDYAASIGLDVHKFCPNCGAKMDGKGETERSNTFGLLSQTDIAYALEVLQNKNLLLRNANTED